jgi:hypothetical protein
VILTDPIALADIPKPVRSRITERLASMLASVAPVKVGLRQGYSDEAPVVYLMPGRESITRNYGTHQVESDFTISVIVDSSDYAIPEYEIVDRLIASVAQAINARDDVLDSVCERRTLTSTRPGYREDQGNMIGAELIYTVSYTADPADPETAI